MRPHSITRSPSLHWDGGTDGAGLAGLSLYPSAPLRCPLGDSGPRLSFPSCGMAHSISTVKPQQLSGPTAQHGSRSSFTVYLLSRQMWTLSPDNTPGPGLDKEARRRKENHLSFKEFTASSRRQRKKRTNKIQIYLMQQVLRAS